MKYPAIAIIEMVVLTHAFSLVRKDTYNNSLLSVKAMNKYTLYSHYPVNLLSSQNPGSDNYSYFAVWN